MTAVQFRNPAILLSEAVEYADGAANHLDVAEYPEVASMITRCAARPFIHAMAVALLAVATATTARAQHVHEHGHPHESTESAITQLQLDGERKWPTDASLRSGMAAIHAAFEADHPAIHAGQETDAQYEALAGRIEAQVNSIVANCKLPPAADANLHYVVADLLQGVSLMRGQDPQRTRHDGAALVHGALIAYGKYFDDPDARP